MMRSEEFNQREALPETSTELFEAVLL